MSKPDLSFLYSKNQLELNEVEELIKAVEAARRNAALLLPLSPAAEQIHTKAYDALPDEVKRSVPKTRVYIDHFLECSGATIPRDSAVKNYKDLCELDIVVSRDMASFANSPTCEHFRRINEQRPTARDLLRYTITHEYGHLFDGAERIKAVAFSYDVPNFLPLEEEVALSEAFAFWFGDIVTGFRGFSDEMMECYKDRADTRLLKKVHETLCASFPVKEGVSYAGALRAMDIYRRQR